MIYCPSMKPWGGGRYPRAYMWNRDATGGPTWGGYEDTPGPYGKAVDLTELQYLWAPYSLTKFHLGALLDGLGLLENDPIDCSTDVGRCEMAETTGCTAEHFALSPGATVQAAAHHAW